MADRKVGKLVGRSADYSAEWRDGQKVGKLEIRRVDSWVGLWVESKVVQ